MNRGARLALSICTIAGLFSSAGVANAQQNLYMDVAYQCYPTALTQYVWLIPDNFIADGWTGTEVNQLEGTIIRAINCSRNTLSAAASAPPLQTATSQKNQAVANAVARPNALNA